jgi:biofilm PGA synthesis lipoprotein PgaB
MHNRLAGRPAALLIVLLSWHLPALTAAEPPTHLVVLQYHHVSNSTPSSTSISPEQFALHLDWLEANGFSVASLPDALAKIRAGDELPDKTVAITFDDGYSDNYRAAFPLLRERGWPFTIFVNPEPHDARLQGWASWDQLREMADAGASIANHTVSHLFMIRRQDDETEDAWLERLRGEIMNAENRIAEETGQRHRLLAYPYGESDRQIRGLINELGFSAFGQQSGAVYAGSDFADLPRFPLSGIYSSIEGFKTKMLSLPMAITSGIPITESADNILSYAENQPVLELQLANSSQLVLNCFASGQGAIPVEYAGSGLYSIQAGEPLGIGRSRYNCTHASDWPGRFHWYSYAWIRQDADGQWTHE